MPIWTDREIALLRSRYGELPVTEIARLLGRRRGAVSMKAMELRLEHRRQLWTDEEIERLKSLSNIPRKEAARVLGRSASAITKKLFDLGLRKHRRKEKFWDEDEIRVLCDLYPQETNRHIARVLQRSKQSVEQKATKLGLKKPGNVATLHRKRNIEKTLLSDGAIARVLATTYHGGRKGVTFDKDLARELQQHPELLDAKRKHIQLRRVIHECKQV